MALPVPWAMPPLKLKSAMRADELWYGSTLQAKVLRTFLTPLSWIYAFGWQIYLGLYRSGIKRVKEPHAPVVCIGNLTVGGSGKTPATLHTYDALLSMGREVVVSCSGYGAPHAEKAVLAPEGELDAAEWGDEAAMLRWLRPEMKLAVGRDRVLSAKLIHESHPDAVMLMDDGFQHLPLRKHLTVLLDDPQPANRRCLPAGPYREPIENRRRADVAIPGDFELCRGGLRLVDPRTMAEVSRPSGPIQALCALGRPERYLNDLGQSGFEVVRSWLLPDHDPLSAGNLLDAVDRALPLAVTAKDWVKLKHRPDIGVFNIWVALQEAHIEPAADFRELLHATLSNPR
jgi:tetraacyldisaccharide 4'-kinase